MSGKKPDETQQPKTSHAGAHDALSNEDSANNNSIDYSAEDS